MNPTFLVSPTEPIMIRALGSTSIVPESYGVDIMWVEPVVGGLVGVQRKEFTDLIASQGDGRLAKEIAQMQALAQATLIVEGRPHWTLDGQLVDSHHRWTRKQFNGLMRSVMGEGVMVEYTDSQGDTVARVEEIAHWTSKPGHHSLKRRPKAKAGDGWGKRTNRDTACWILQSVEGISRKTAEVILDAFGGNLPLGLTCTKADLLAIKGIGPKTADSLIEAFGITDGC